MNMHAPATVTIPTEDVPHATAALAERITRAFADDADNLEMATAVKAVAALKAIADDRGGVCTVGYVIARTVAGAMMAHAHGPAETFHNGDRTAAIKAALRMCNALRMVSS